MTDAVAIAVAALKASSAFTSLLGSDRAIYPVSAPQKTNPPYAVVNIAGGNDDQTLIGAAAYYESRVEVECIAENGSDAIEIGSAALHALEDVIKQSLAGASDVDIYFANTDVTAAADDGLWASRTLHFYLRWRAAQ